MQEIDVAIEQLPLDEKVECLKSIKSASQKEFKEGEIPSIRDYYHTLIEQTSQKISCITNKDYKKSIYECIGITKYEENEKILTRVKKKTSIYENLEEQTTLQTILNQSDDIVDLFDKAKNVQSQNRSESRVHGVQHIRNVLLLSNYLGKQNGINGKDLEMLRA